MKKTFLLIGLVAFRASVWGAVGDVFSAKTVEGIDMTFRVTNENGKRCQVGNFECAIDASTEGVVSIPSEVNGYSVDWIGQNAFYGTKISSVVIPESVTSIYYNAFEGCDNIEEFTLPASVYVVAEGAFRNCSALKKLIIEDGEESIFISRGFELNATKKSEYESMFQFCPLEDIYIGREVKYDAYIDGTGVYSPFQRIRTLRNVTIFGHGNIGSHMFTECTALNNIQIASGASEVNDNAFSNCSSLSSIHLPNTIRRIGKDAFYGTNLSEIVLSSSLETIDDRAFWYCKQLTSVDLPVSLKHIGYHAFYETGISTLNLPIGLQSMGADILSSWANLSIPSTLTKIERQTVNGPIEIPTHNPVYYAPDGCNAVIIRNTNKLLFGSPLTVIPDFVTEIADSAFFEVRLPKVLIPNSVKKIGKYAFYDNQFAESIQFGNSVEYIGDDAFYRVGIKRMPNATVELPNSVKIIGRGVFHGCYNIRKIIVGDGVEEVDYLGGLDALSVVILGKSVKRIGSIAGLNNARNKTFNALVIKSEAAPEITKGNRTSPYYTAQDIKNIFDNIIVPTSSMESYQNGEYWKDMASTFITFENEPLIVQAEVLEAGVTHVKAVYDYLPLDSLHDFGGSIASRDTLTSYGIDPSNNAIQRINWNDNHGNRGTVPVSTNLRGGRLVLEALPAQAISDKRVVVSSKTNGEDDALRFGFEWRRYDAPDLVPSTYSPCPAYQGVIAGILINLSANTYYKYRPYYKSDSGKYYYGEWMAFGTADAYVYFEPVVHTYEAQQIGSNTAKFRGYALPGSDDVTEQGFEYWPENHSSRMQIAATDDTRFKVTAGGQLMEVTIEGLQPATQYSYRSFVRTNHGDTYGEIMTFKTAEDVTAINGITLNNEVSVSGYYNMQGRKITIPEHGVIVILYSDGTTKKMFVK